MVGTKIGYSGSASSSSVHLFLISDFRFSIDCLPVYGVCAR